jgi:hypothetical protein
MAHDTKTPRINALEDPAGGPKLATSTEAGADKAGDILFLAKTSLIFGITTGQSVILTFDSVPLDTNGSWTGSAHSCVVPGKYLVNFTSGYSYGGTSGSAPAAGNTVLMNIYKNGSSVGAVNRFAVLPTDPNIVGLQVAVDLEEGDSIDVRVIANFSGGRQANLVFDGLNCTITYLGA